MHICLYVYMYICIYVHMYVRTIFAQHKCAKINGTRIKHFLSEKWNKLCLVTIIPQK